MYPAIISEPTVVATRLNELGWTREELIDVVHAAVSGRNGCTLNDPPGSPGWRAWQEATRRLREIGIQKGMERDNSDQIACLFDRARNIKIAVSNTNDGTGTEEGQPANRSKKGAATDRLVSNNGGALGTILDDSRNVVALHSPEAVKSIYWYLCIYTEGDVTRAELSCPTSCESGYFTSFNERIVIVGTDDEDDFVRDRFRSLDDGDEFEISVTRKSS